MSQHLARGIVEILADGQDMAVATNGPDRAPHHRKGLDQTGHVRVTSLESARAASAFGWA